MKNREAKEQLEGNQDLLERLQGKYSLQKDLNLMYRRFYSRNVLDQLKKDEFELSLDQCFKDFNMAMMSKDNFIGQNMDLLERVVDKTTIIKSESLRELLFGDLDKVVENEAKAEKKAEKLEKERIALEASFNH